MQDGIGAFVALALLAGVHVSAIREYDMHYNCKNKISMILDGVHQAELELDAEKLTSGVSRFPFICETAIESWYSWPYLSVYIKEVDIRCSDGFLELFDGISRESIKGLPGKICGESYSSMVFSTTSMTLRVRYTAFRRTSSDDTLSLIFTAYSKDQECYEHKCTNGRCIHKDATCTGYDSCGDKSDCEHGLKGAAVAGIVIGSLVGLGVLISAVVVLCCCVKKKTTKRQQGRGTEPRVAYMANPAPAQTGQAPPISFSHPAYGVTNQGFVSAQQPAYPVNFSCPVYNALEPASPPEYSELYPEYAPSGNIGSEASAAAPEKAKEAPPGQDFSSVTTLQVRGINNDSEAGSVNRGFEDIPEPVKK